MRTHRFLIPAILAFVLAATPAPGQWQGTGDELAAQLKAALEQYNNHSESEGSRDEFLGEFWVKKGLVTPSLAAGLKRGGNFEADPFLLAQDVVPGIFTKRVEMGEEVARIEVGIKQYSAGDPSIMMTYILSKEEDGWKIDDIDYADAKMNGESLGMTTLKDALR